MNRNKVKEMIHFSFYQNFQNKWFIIFNLIAFISIILGINWGSFSSLLHPHPETTVLEVAVLDSYDLLYDDFAQALEGNNAYHVTRITTNDYTAENIPDDFMIIEVKPQEEEVFEVAIISKEGILLSQYNPIKDILFSLRNHLLAQKYEIEESTLEIMQRDLTIERVMLSVAAGDASTKEIIKFFSAAFTYLITVFIFSKIANDIASEKQSKSTEYILTTVSAKEYLFAKIFSSITVLLLQGLLMLSYYYIAVLILHITRATYTDLSVSASLITNTFSKDIVYYFLTLIVYNVMNLILLCILQATFASKTSSTAEAGNTTSLLLFVMMIAYIATIYFLRPDLSVNWIIAILACLPILSAYFIPGLMVIGQATIWQIIISLLLLVITIPLTFRFCAKVFKNGILNYTKPKKKKHEEIKNDIFLQRKVKNFGFVIGMSIILYVGIQTILSLLGSFVLTSLWQGRLQDSEITLLLQILLQVVSLGVTAFFLFSYIPTAPRIHTKPMTLKKKVEIIFITIFLVFALQFFLSLVLYPALGLNYDTTELFGINASSRSLSKIILVIALSIIPAFFEELVFRKGVMNYSMQFGKVFALLFSAIFFGIMHMNVSQGLFAFMMGLILGSIYLYTGDIKLTMLIHMINNGFAAFELILPGFSVVILVAILLLCILVGFIFAIKRLANKDFRAKLIRWCRTPLSLSRAKETYQYLFYDYTFDISLLLLVLMSFVIEKILR